MSDTRQGGRPYRGMSPEARRSERRRRLLDTGLELFGTAGHANTSIEQICAQASVTTRHFYEEYGSREELLKAVYAEIVMLAWSQTTEAVAAAPFELGARIRAGAEAFVRSMLEDDRRARVFCIEVVGVSPEMEDHRRSVLRMIAGMIQHYAEELRVDEPAVFPEGLNYTYTTLGLVGGMIELMVEWLMGGKKITLERLVEVVVELFMLVGAPTMGYAPAVTLS